jgi:hypothetical protein
MVNIESNKTETNLQSPEYTLHKPVPSAYVPHAKTTGNGSPKCGGMMRIERVSMLHVVLRNQDDTMLRNQAERGKQKADTSCGNRAAPCGPIINGAGYNYVERYAGLCEIDMR